MDIVKSNPIFIAEQFETLVEEDNEGLTFFYDYEALKPETETKVKWSPTYVVLSGAAFVSSAIACKFFQSQRTSVTATLAFGGAMAGLAFLYVSRQVRQVPTEACTRIRAAFKKFCEPLIQALNDGRTAKTNALIRVIQGPQDNPKHYDDSVILKNHVSSHINTYDNTSKNALEPFFNENKSDYQSITEQIEGYQQAAKLVGQYLDKKFQDKIPKNLDLELQKELVSLNQAATTFLYGYDKPAKEEPKDAKPYVNATLNADKTATVKSWIKGNSSDTPAFGRIGVSEKNGRGLNGD